MPTFSPPIAILISSPGLYPAASIALTIYFNGSSLSFKLGANPPSSPTDVVNPLSCLLQFNHVGKFVFVEEKTFITPPDLPYPPMKPKLIDEAKKKLAGMLMLYGLIAFFVGILLLGSYFSSLYSFGLC